VGLRFCGQGIFWIGTLSLSFWPYFKVKNEDHRVFDSLSLWSVMKLEFER
jgi:hypothetical protein